MKAIDHGDRNSKKIALTFDDGPNPFWTPKILALLDKSGIKGNFFVLGKWARLYPAIVKDMYRQGHLIGNHGYSHSKDTADFGACEDVLRSITGEKVNFIRPPYLNAGLCAGYGPAESSFAKIINTDVFPHDYKHTAQEIVDFVLNHTVNGSIILLHDGSQRETDLENRPAEMFASLPEIIMNLRNKFVFSRLDEMELE